MITLIFTFKSSYASWFKSTSEFSSVKVSFWNGARYFLHSYYVSDLTETDNSLNVRMLGNSKAVYKRQVMKYSIHECNTTVDTCHDNMSNQFNEYKLGVELEIQQLMVSSWLKGSKPLKPDSLDLVPMTPMNEYLKHINLLVCFKITRFDVICPWHYHCTIDITVIFFEFMLTPNAKHRNQCPCLHISLIILLSTTQKQYPERLYKGKHENIALE